jgi:zinc transporter 9
MDPFLWLVLLSIAMFAGSYVAGNIPLSLTLHESRLKFLSALGAGLLIGSALMVIIPEGVATVYNTGGNIAQRFGGASVVGSSVEEGSRVLLYARSVLPVTPPLDQQPVQEDKHRTVGLSLALGFAVMLCIDHMAPHAHALHISITDLHTTLPATMKQQSTASIGLILHAAADGMALGAAFATHQPNLEMLLFFAVFLHKAPAAFGLVTHLLREGRTRLAIQRHVVVFSLASPLAALISYILLWMVNGGDSDWIKHSTGVILLFSAGTFLYVAAVHGLQELGTGKRLARWQVMTVIAGMLFPMLVPVQ